LTNRVVSRYKAAKTARAHPILNASRMNDHHEQRAQRINRDMTLAALDFLARSVPPTACPSERF
jgi:hypothetical protein